MLSSDKNSTNRKIVDIVLRCINATQYFLTDNDSRDEQLFMEDLIADSYKMIIIISSNANQLLMMIQLKKKKIYIFITFSFGYETTPMGSDAPCEGRFVHSLCRDRRTA